MTGAISGEEGLELLKVNEYDIVLVGFLMPSISGNEMIEAFHDWKSNSKTQLTTINDNMLIWGVSATACLHEQREGVLAVMHIFSEKPLSKDIMKHVVNIYIYKENSNLEQTLDVLLNNDSRHEKITMSFRDNIHQFETPSSKSLSRSESKGITRSLREYMMTEVTKRIFVGNKKCNNNKIVPTNKSPSKYT